VANILIIDDDPKICESLSDIFDSLGHQASVATSIKEGSEKALNGRFDIILLDLEFGDGNGIDILPQLIKAESEPEVIIITGTGDLQGAKIAFKYGAWDFIKKPFTFEEVSLPIVRALQYRTEREESRSAPAVLKRAGIIGSSHAIQVCLDDVARASSTNVSALITGETGTGKELFARAIHENSRRSSGSFIAVDCGAIPDTLAEESFFGHEKGAFTGADSKRDGVIKQADSGTLFLDEIGDLSLNVQKALLRALQEKSVRPLGGKEISVDFRLVAATNSDLVKEVKEKSFREDLLYRIRAIEIKLPPLRSRKEDIEEILLHRIHQICKQEKTGVKGVSPEYLKCLVDHDWPGNVRELINVIEFSVASSGIDKTLYPKHLPPEYRVAMLGMESPQDDKMITTIKTDQDFSNNFPTLSEYRDKNEMHYLEELIKRASGDREKACRLSGMSQARLYTLMKKYNLSLFRS
jgi:two-component system, NtrC family, response regulator